MHTKKELLQGCLTRYLQADKQQKTIILDELQAHTKMHRKSLIRALKRLQMEDYRIGPKKRGRKVVYGPDVTAALNYVWEASRHLCGERLKPILAEYVRILKRDKMWRFGDSTTKLLLQMSLGTMKKRIAQFNHLKRKQRQSTTKPSNLRYLIPVRRGPWENPLPGYGEIDTVVHCGQSLAGDVAYSVNYTDIATCWAETRAQLNKGQFRTLQSIKSIAKSLPFTLRGLDPDTGSEFINWHLKEWSDKNEIELTRSRPYHRNDNAHIEQKNYTSVRTFFGWRRIDTQEQVELMNKLYQGPLRLYLNFFQPVMKCISKKRIGSRYVRNYDQTRTPYQRVLEHLEINKKNKEKLKKIYQTLNPLKLKQEIDNLLKKI